MDAHKMVDEIINRKEYEDAKKELIRLAQENIHGFIMNCEHNGFRIGIKVGFLGGLLVGLIIYLIFIK